MPFGSRARPIATGPGYSPSGRASVPSGSIDLGGGAIVPAADVWEHFTVTADELAGGAIVHVATPAASRVVIDEFDGTVLYVRFDNAALTSAPGQYDLKHPGSGELDRSVPAFTTLYMFAATDPTNNVEVYCLGGLYGVRPT